LSKWYEGNKGSVTSDSVLDPANSVEQLSVDPAMMSIGGKKRSIVVATTKSFAVEVIVDKKTRERKCCNMIIKNDSMPDGLITVSNIFGTVDADQGEVEIAVYESDFMDEYFDVDEDYAIGTATLELPENLPADSPIEITFSLNSEGILEVTGKDITSNKEIRATMRSKYIMNSETVEELKEKSKQMAVI
jgi:molecular chaperone DnaK (HSP70)